MKNEVAQEEPSPEKGLSAKQLKGIAAILAESSMERAAEKAGVNRTTLYRWLEIPAFRTELEREQRAAFSGALARLQGAARLAVERLIEALDSGNPNERRLAASEILDLCFRGKEIGEFSERLAELEDKYLIGRPGSVS